jgi:hypothetical protein
LYILRYWNSPEKREGEEFKGYVNLRTFDQAKRSNRPKEMAGLSSLEIPFRPSAMVLLPWFVMYQIPSPPFHKLQENIEITRGYSRLYSAQEFLLLSYTINTDPSPSKNPAQYWFDIIRHGIAYLYKHNKKGNIQ